MSSRFDLTDDTLRLLYHQCGKSVPATVERVKALYEASGGTNVLRMGTLNLPIDTPQPSMATVAYVEQWATNIVTRIAAEKESDEEDSPIIGRKKAKARVGSEEDSPIIGRKKREAKRESKHKSQRESKSRPQRQRKKPNRFAPSVSDSEFDDDYSEDSPVKPNRRKHSKRHLRKGSDFVDDAAECDEDDEEEEGAGSPGSVDSNGDLRDFIVPSHESTPAASTPGSVATPGSVKVTGERSREERDAEGRANAIDLITPDHA